MGFLEAVCTRCDADLTAVSHFVSWSQLNFGTQSGWGINFFANVKEKIVPRARDAMISIVLGAKNSEVDFVETMRELKQNSTHPKNTTILIW
jgi:hypothetical protein